MELVQQKPVAKLSKLLTPCLLSWPGVQLTSLEQSVIFGLCAFEALALSIELTSSCDKSE